MTNEKVKELLKIILGRSAYDNSMTVPKDITKLVKSVDYLYFFNFLLYIKLR